MKYCFENSSVNGGMMNLLDLFCFIQKLKSPVQRNYHVYERVLFKNWLQSIKFIDEQYKKEGLELEIAKLVSSNHIGMCSYLSGACNDFDEYINMYIKYSKLWYDFTDKKKYQINGHSVLTWESSLNHLLDGYSKQIVISDVLQVAIFYIKTLKFLHRPVQVFSKIEFANLEVQDIKKYENFFNCEIIFAAKQTRLFFTHEVFNMTFDVNDRLLHEMIKNNADKMLNDMNFTHSFIDRVNQGIHASIEQQKPQIEYVANYLNISTINLQKKLKENNNSFKNLLNDIRLDLAKKYLKDTNLAMIDISGLLCYKEQTSFNRAFKNGTGKSPKQWRNS